MSNSDGLRERIFKSDGTVRGLHYCAPAARRRAVLTIKLGKPKTPGFFSTSLIVDGRDFAAVYQEAITKIARWYGVSDARILADMKLSAPHFLATFGLVLREVTYQQVERR